MNRELKTRIKYFKIGSRSTSLNFNTSDNLYYCPICGKGFPIKAVHDGRLTLEHVPPKSLGGKHLVLTCRECNSDSGHSIDAAAARRKDLESFIGMMHGKESSTKSMKANIAIDGRTVSIKLSRTNNITQIKIVKSASSPKDLRYVRDRFKTYLHCDASDKSRQFTITTSSKNFHSDAIISDLKTAFLASFALLGYRFAMHSNLLQVRQQILQSNLDIIGRHFCLEKTDMPLGQPILISATKPYPCIAAILEKRVILLPEPEGIGNLYELLNKHHTRSTFLNGKKLGWPQSMELRLDYLCTNIETRMGF